LYDWSNRFDDPDDGPDRYQAISAAEDPLTALCEVLQDFRPSATLLVEFRAWLQTRYPDEAERDEALNHLALRGKLPREWFDTHTLVCAIIAGVDGELANLEDPALLTRLGETDPLPEMLAERGELHLTVNVVLARDRVLSQRVGKLLYSRNAAGLIHRSNVGAAGQCVALFSSRGHLEPLEPDEVQLLESEHPLIVEALTALNLEVEW
jgi:hypothetical protein